MAGDVQEPHPTSDADDGRLDLDRLEDAYVLDVVADDAPLASDRLTDWLARAGVLGFARRHRAVLSAAALVASVAAAYGVVRWATRPQPLPEPARVVAQVSGPSPILVTDVTTGTVTAVVQQLVISVAEPASTTVSVLGLTGPGLVVAPGASPQPLDPAHAGVPVSATGLLSCDPQPRAAAGGYSVVVRRTSDSGQTATDVLALQGGGEQLAALVRRICVQQAAAAELKVDTATVTRVPGVVALDVGFTLSATSDSVWTHLRAGRAGDRQVVGQGPPTTVRPGAPGTVVARVWPSDCADPIADLDAGLPLDGARTDADGALTVAPDFLLALPTAARAAISDEATRVCGTSRVTGAVTSTDLTRTTSPGTGGTVVMAVTLTAPGADLLETEPGDASGSGALQPSASPLHLHDGAARLDVTWQVAPCGTLPAAGLPELSVQAVSLDPEGGLRRPYLVRLDGASLRLALTRMCPDVAPEIRSAAD